MRPGLSGHNPAGSQPTPRDGSHTTSWGCLSLCLAVLVGKNLSCFNFVLKDSRAIRSPRGTSRAPLASPHRASDPGPTYLNSPLLKLCQFINIFLLLGVLKQCNNLDAVYWPPAARSEAMEYERLKVNGKWGEGSFLRQKRRQCGTQVWLKEAVAVPHGDYLALDKGRMLEQMHWISADLWITVEQDTVGWSSTLRRLHGSSLGAVQLLFPFAEQRDHLYMLAWEWWLVCEFSILCLVCNCGFKKPPFRIPLTRT